MVVRKYKRPGAVVTHSKIITARSRLGKEFIKHGEIDASKHFSITNEDLEPIAMQMESFWRTHIYDTFNARIRSGHKTSGQLGRSLTSRLTDDGISFFMKPIYNTQVKEYDRPSRNVSHNLSEERESDKSRFKPRVEEAYGNVKKISWEYGGFLRKGTKRNKDYRYNKYLDKLIYTGSEDLKPTTASKSLNALISALDNPRTGGQSGVDKRIWMRWMNKFRAELRKTTTEKLRESFHRKQFRAGGR